MQTLIDTHEWARHFANSLAEEKTHIGILNEPSVDLTGLPRGNSVRALFLFASSIVIDVANV
jgi:hypothetical protein